MFKEKNYLNRVYTYKIAACCCRTEKHPDWSRLSFPKKNRNWNFLGFLNFELLNWNQNFIQIRFYSNKRNDSFPYSKLYSALLELELEGLRRHIELFKIPSDKFLIRLITYIAKKFASSNVYLIICGNNWKYFQQTARSKPSAFFD